VFWFCFFNRKEHKEKKVAKGAKEIKIKIIIIVLTAKAYKKLGPNFWL
jgi:hypothetical protein